MLILFIIITLIIKKINILLKSCVVIIKNKNKLNVNTFSIFLRKFTKNKRIAPFITSKKSSHKKIKGIILILNNESNKFLNLLLLENKFAL